MRARFSERPNKNRPKLPILLLAHSMGSIIAYDVLRTLEEHSTLRIKHLVTLGLPLGLPIVSHNIWEEFREKRTPKMLEQWSNIAVPGDKVALDCHLSDEYKANGKDEKVNDVLVHNDYRSPAGVENTHKSYGYLRTPEVSDLIFEFLKGEPNLSLGFGVLLEMHSWMIYFLFLKEGGTPARRVMQMSPWFVHLVQGERLLENWA